MTDTTLNQFISSGTAAERGAFTPAPATPAAGNDPSYIWLETDTGDVYMWDFGGSAWMAVGTGPGGSATIVAPQGRLTLTSNTPVMTADATAQTSVYYTPYVGEFVPLYTGAAWAMHEFTQLTMSLDTSNQLSGSLYDLFIVNDSGTIKIGAGPAWSSTTSRGTGAGTTELELKDGIWTNKVSIALKNGAGAAFGTFAANLALYVGTIYCTANGQTGMAMVPSAASGGTNNILGLYNAYNRVQVRAKNRNNKVSWTTTSTSWQTMDGSSSMRISFVDGLQQSRVRCSLNVVGGTATTTDAAIGLVLDSTSADPTQTAQMYGTSVGTLSVHEVLAPQLGFHYVQAMQACSGGTFSLYSAQTSPNRQHHAQILEMEM